MHLSNLRFRQGLSGKMMPDRRQYPRRSTCAPCPPSTISFDGNWKAVAVDLSEGGLGVVSARNLAVGLRPQFQLDLAGTRIVRATGRVVWCDHSGRAGLVLSNPVPVVQAEIRNWLAASSPAEPEDVPPYPGSPVDSLSDWVAGPLPLQLPVLSHGIHENRVGVYMLGHGNGSFHVVRLGRADDLREALVAYIGQYDQFLYSYCTSLHDAFRRECRLYHYYRPRNNNSHPVRSPGTTWDCPICHGFK